MCLIEHVAHAQHLITMQPLVRHAGQRFVEMLATAMLARRWPGARPPLRATPGPLRTTVAQTANGTTSPPSVRHGPRRTAVWLNFRLVPYHQNPHGEATRDAGDETGDVKIASAAPVLCTRGTYIHPTAVHSIHNPGQRSFVLSHGFSNGLLKVLGNPPSHLIAPKSRPALRSLQLIRG